MCTRKRSTDRRVLRGTWRRRTTPSQRGKNSAATSALTSDSPSGTEKTKLKWLHSKQHSKVLKEQAWAIIIAFISGSGSICVPEYLSICSGCNLLHPSLSFDFQTRRCFGICSKPVRNILDPLLILSSFSLFLNISKESGLDSKWGGSARLLKIFHMITLISDQDHICSKLNHDP